MSASDVLTMPKLGLTMEEGTVVEWYVRAGDSFAKGQAIFSVETEKIITDIEASVDGRLEHILVKEGQSAAIGTPVARLVASPAGSQTSARGELLTGYSAGVETAVVLDAHEGEVNGSGSRYIATPRARALATEAGLDIGQIVGSGPGGRVKAADIERAIGNHLVTRLNATPASDNGTGLWREATRTEKSIAARLTGVKREVPHFYLSTEVDVAALMLFRQRAPKNADGKSPSVTQLIVAGVARSIAANPMANRSWDNDGYRSHATVDVGVAVHTSYGLLVPIVKDIGDASLNVIGHRMSLLVKKARERELTADDVTGGAISVSNAGMHDVTQMVSVISPGQSSIVGVGSIRRVFRPNAASMPELREELNLTMSFDHRVFDGVSGLKLLNAIKARLESPSDAFV